MLAVLAVVVAVAVGVAAALTSTDSDRHLTGALVAGSVLVICWVLLGVGVTWFHRHLAAKDRERWGADWDRVGPEWTRGPQRPSGPDTTDPSMTG